MSDKLPHTEVTQYLNVLVDLTGFRAVRGRRWRGHRCLVKRRFFCQCPWVIDLLHARATVAGLNGCYGGSFAC